MIDTKDFYEIDAAANSTRDKVEKGQWQEAFEHFVYTLAIISNKTCDIDLYNILTKKRCNSYLSRKSFYDEGIRSFLI